MLEFEENIMDPLTLADISPERCPWPCKLEIIANIIIVLAAIKVVVQYLQTKASGSK